MKIYYTFTILIVFLLMHGCSVKMGHTGAQTSFVYPNSNVEVLGHVKASIKKSSFLIYPYVTSEDVKAIRKKAMLQTVGANLIINYKFDTEVISFIGMNYMIITLEGDAAKMEAGKQILN